MTTRQQRRRRLVRLFRRSPAADLPTIQRALDTTSRTTVFRALSEVGYRTSYSHAGRYYTLEEIPQFDEQGLWAHGDALFSKNRTLRATIIALVQQAPAGQTHAEIRERLRLRVHDTLRDLARAQKIGRVQMERLYLYVSIEQAIARAQLAERKQQIDATPSSKEPAPAVVIDVLLEVIHTAGARASPVGIARRLAARGVAVTPEQVEEIFREHGIQKKGVRSRSRRSPR